MWRRSVVDDMDEIVQEFLVESHENLDQLDRDLVALERDPARASCCSSIFRTIHTIKGTSGFLAFGQLESRDPRRREPAGRLRDGDWSLTPPPTDALLQMVDAVRAILAAIEETGTEGDGRLHRPAWRRRRRCSAARSAAGRAGPAARQAPAPGPAEPAERAAGPPSGGGPPTAGRRRPRERRRHPPEARRRRPASRQAEGVERRPTAPSGSTSGCSTS